MLLLGYGRSVAQSCLMEPTRPARNCLTEAVFELSAVQLVLSAGAHLTWYTRSLKSLQLSWIPLHCLVA